MQGGGYWEPRGGLNVFMDGAEVVTVESGGDGPFTVLLASEDGRAEVVALLPEASARALRDGLDRVLMPVEGRVRVVPMPGATTRGGDAA